MDNPFPAVRPVVGVGSTDLGLRLVPLIGLTGVLWTYIVSHYVYRMWYVAAALALGAAVMLIVARKLKIGGLVAASVPVIGYFAVLAAGAAWAELPRVTLKWVAIDGIQLVVFVLAFLVARNAKPEAIGSAMMTIVIPAVAMAAYMHANHPSDNRPAPYAVALLPFVMPFAVLRGIQARSRWPAAATIVAGFAVLVFGNSRTQLGTACVLTGIAVLVFRRDLRAVTRALLLYATLIAIAVAILAFAPPTRYRIAKMFARTMHVEMTWGDVSAPPEGVNVDRAAIEAVSRSLLPEAFPLGLGYRNFPHRFAQVMGHSRPIHNTYMIWLLEGGVPCVAVVLLLAWLHVRNLRIAIREAPSRDHRAFGQACAIASLGILTIAFFHQVNQTPPPWMLLGFAAAFAAGARERRDRAGIDDHPQARALLERWRGANPAFAPALCEPLMATAFRHLSACERGALIADVGCGDGFMLPLFREAGYRTVGVDADPSVIPRRSGLPVVCAQGEQLPLASSSVDGLFVFSAFQYMDRETALRECHRVLKPGGRFAIVENLAGNPVARLSRLVRRVRGARYSVYMEPLHHLRWKDRAIYERHFPDVTYHTHHILTPLFLLCRTIAAPLPTESRRNRLVQALFRALQRLERRALEKGWGNGAAWHLVAFGRK